MNEMFTFDATNAELNEKFFRNLDKKTLKAFLKPKFSGAYIANCSYDLDKANAAIKAG